MELFMLCFKINNFHATVNCHLVKSFTIVYNKHYQLIQEEMFESVVVLFIVVAQGWMITEKDYQKDKNVLKLRTNCSSYKSSLAYHLSNVKFLLGFISFTSTFSNLEI